MRLKSKAFFNCAGSNTAPHSILYINKFDHNVIKRVIQSHYKKIVLNDQLLEKDMLEKSSAYYQRSFLEMISLDVRIPKLLNGRVRNKIGKDDLSGDITIVPKNLYIVRRNTGFLKRKIMEVIQ
jgi:hypothetical protein